MRMLLTILLVALSTAWASAETIKLSTGRVMGMTNALLSLDGHDVKLSDDRVIRQPYKLSGSTRIAIAKNLAKMQDLIALIQKTQAKATADAKDDAEREALARDIMATDHDVDLVVVAVKDLNLDVNPIAPSVLNMLWPALKEDLP